MNWCVKRIYNTLKVNPTIPCSRTAYERGENSRAEQDLKTSVRLISLAYGRWSGAERKQDRDTATPSLTPPSLALTLPSLLSRPLARRERDLSNVLGLLSQVHTRSLCVCRIDFPLYHTACRCEFSRRAKLPAAPLPPPVPFRKKKQHGETRARSCLTMGARLYF